MKHLLCRHIDVLTLPERFKKLYEEYQAIGYEMLTEPNMSGFSYGLIDGSVITVYFENGKIYEEINVQ
jgi:hypothetical protein